MTENGHNQLSSELDLLATALVSRAENVADLAELALKPEDETRQLVDTLADQGLIVLKGDRLEYRSIDLILRQRAEDLVAETASDLSKKLAEINELVRQAPKLLMSWREGTPSRSSHTEVLHGAFAPTDLWLRFATRKQFKTTDGILPDAERIFVADDPSQKKWFEAISRDDLKVRTILSSAQVNNPDALKVITADMKVGAEFRMHPDPPSWMWIADDEVVGLPMQWGSKWPTSVFATDDPGVVSLVRWLYDHLWDSSVDVTSGSKDWDALLELMSRGATLEAASMALGISARTGRRRLAQAAEFYRVDGLFALGVAWQKSAHKAG